MSYKKLKIYIKCALLALINYFRKTQKRSLDYLQVAHVIKTNKALQIDAYSRLNLELTRTIRSDEKYGSLYWYLIILKLRWVEDY